MVRQYDQQTGEELTPAYEVPRSPSIIYQPPGVPVDGVPHSAGFIAKFSRMNPQGAKELRDHVYAPRPVAPKVPAPWETGPWDSPPITYVSILAQFRSHLPLPLDFSVSSMIPSWL